MPLQGSTYNKCCIPVVESRSAVTRDVDSSHGDLDLSWIKSLFWWLSPWLDDKWMTSDPTWTGKLKTWLDFRHDDSNDLGPDSTQLVTWLDLPDVGLAWDSDQMTLVTCLAVIDTVNQRLLWTLSSNYQGNLKCEMRWIQHDSFCWIHNR